MHHSAAHRYLASATSVCLAALACVAPAQAQCEWGWSPGFEGNGGGPFISWDSVVFDDGTGPAIYMCTDAGRVSKFQYGGWREIGKTFGNPTGTAVGKAYNLHVCDPDGAGPLGEQLFVCGAFRRIQGPNGAIITSNGVARWDGAEWTNEAPPQLGTGLYALRAMTAYNNDGTGKKLVVAHEDIPIGQGILVREHDGSWQQLDPFLFVPSADELNALHAFDDGTGEALYVGGLFEGLFGFDGTVNSPGVIKWTGSAWVGLGAGVQYTTGEGGRVYSLNSLNDGAGEKLYAAGNIASSGGDTTIRGVAKWTGSAWVGLADADFVVGQFGPYLHVLNTGSGDELYLVGRLGAMANQGIAKWTGTAWTGVDWDTTAYGNPLTVAAFDVDGVGGDGMRLVSGSPVRERIGSEWRLLPTSDGSRALSPVSRLSTLDADGAGPDVPALFAVGSFSTELNGQTLNRVARFDGSNWSPVFGDLATLSVFDLDTNDTFASGASSVAAFDDGGGTKLYVGGTFNQLAGVEAKRILRWSGSAWEEVGGGIGEYVNNGRVVFSMSVFNDGSGPALFAAGAFTSAGGSPVSNIAKWNGTAWSDVGGGIDGTVLTSAVFDDGSGPALYVGGTFSMAGGVAATNIAKWNGTAWSDVGGGTNAEVAVLHVHDDGTGARLYAGGSFVSAGGVTVNRVAAWNGAAWSDLAGGVARGAGFTGAAAVRSMASSSLNGQSVLIAGGSFEVAGGIGIGGGAAAWNGSAWQAMEGGIRRSAIGTISNVVAMAALGNSVYAAGTFEVAGNVGSGGFAEWTVTTVGDYNRDDTVDLADLIAFNTDWQPNIGQNVPVGTMGDYNDDGMVDLADLIAFNTAWQPNIGGSCP